MEFVLSFRDKIHNLGWIGTANMHAYKKKKKKTFFLSPVAKLRKD